MESRAVRIGWIVMLILGVYWGIFGGLFMIASPEVTVHAPFESSTGQSWESFVAANTPAAIDHINWAFIMHGVKQLAEGVLIIGIALYAYRRRQKWSWYTLLASGLIIWVSMLFSGATPMVPVIALVLLIIALAVPAKDILVQKSS